MRSNNVGGFWVGGVWLGGIRPGRASFLLAAVTAVVAGGAWRLALADAARPATTPWGGDPAGAKPGEIVIRPTGRTVRVITLATHAPTGKAANPVRVVAVTTASAHASTAAAARFDPDAGLEYGPQSVRLPLEYDPRDNFGYGSGPITYAPACYGGFYGSTDSYCGYGSGYGAYGYGGGYGYGGYGYPGGFRHAYGHQGFGGYAPIYSSFCGR